MDHFINLIISFLFVFGSYHVIYSQNDVVRAAQLLLEDLDQRAKQQILFDIEDESREIWHYLPLASFDRFGLSLKDLDDKQDKLVMDLLGTCLSDTGLKKAKQIMMLEEVLQVLEHNTTSRDPEQYHLAIYGNPGMDRPWSWSFSGHHLSLHFTIVNGRIASTPFFMGSNPAEVMEGLHKGLRVLGAEEDLGLELVRSLSPMLREKAIFSSKAPSDILSAARSRVSPEAQQGIRYTELSETQQGLLQVIVEMYAKSLNPALASSRLEAVREMSYEEVWFAWAGVTDRSRGHYYRIQSPTFLIEFDNTQNNANHVHTVWRDFAGDFGRDLLADHYRRNHKE